MGNGQLTPEEIAQIENEGDQLTGRVHDGFDIFAGSDPADVRARRLDSGTYWQSDIEPTPPDPIDNYQGPRELSQVTTGEELHDFINYHDALAREKYDDWDDVIDNWFWPAYRNITPQQLAEFVSQPNFADRAYRIGLERRAQYFSGAPTQEETERMDGDEFGARMQQWASSARSKRDEEQESQPFITKREMKAMNGLKYPVDFGKVLDAIKARGT